MSPRKYNRERRDLAQQETRRRIIEAVVLLHAERGALNTTYADIAKRADVAVPTVYKHFPTRAELLQGCTAHVAEAAPRLDSGIFDELESIEDRLEALVQAVFKLHAYYHPWLRWGEARQLPELQPITAESRKDLESFIRAASAPLRLGDVGSFVAVAMTLLNAHAWEALRNEQNLSQTRAIALVVRALKSVAREFEL